MFRRIVPFLVAGLLLAALSPVTLEAKGFQRDSQKDYQIWFEQYGFMQSAPKKISAGDFRPDAGAASPAAPVSMGGQSFGPFPGTQVGASYFDRQANGTMGRYVDWRGGPQIHMTWMASPDSGFFDRAQAYRVFDPRSGTIAPNVVTELTQPAAYSGYGTLDVAPYDDGGPSHYGGAAVVGIHSWDGTDNLSDLLYQDPDVAPDDFAVNRMPLDTNANYVAIFGAWLIWPRIEYQEFGATKVTHVVTSQTISSASDPFNTVYFRKVGDGVAGDWTNGHIVTAGENGISASIAASRVSQRVAIGWVEFPLAGLDPLEVYYKKSEDAGVTWSSATNASEYKLDGLPYTAWSPTFTFIDSDDNIHLAWSQHPDFGDGTLGIVNRIVHWYEPTGILSTVVDAEWDLVPVACLNRKAPQGTAYDFSLSECNGRLYCIWSQANDPNNEVFDDCASTTSPNWGVNHSGNADLFMGVSADLTGLGWDVPRNLTNTYTPECDTVSTFQGNCAGEMQAGVSRFGMDNSAFGFTLNFSNAQGAATDVDPSGGSYAGSHYLDVLYIADENPGQWTADFGWPTLNDMQWFRLPCVEAVTSPAMILSEYEVGYPSWSKHGVDSTIQLVVENQGNEDLIITDITPISDIGPEGWLAVDLIGFNQTIPFGVGAADTLGVVINNNGVVNSPGTPVVVRGRVEFVSNDPNSPIYFEIDNWVIADTLRELEFAVIGTGCISIALGNNGDMGFQGGDGNSSALTGRVNMDFWDCNECDTFYDSLPGDASVYLYDGSPVVLRGSVDGVDTTVSASFSVFGNSFVSPVGFRPVPEPTDDTIVVEANFVGFGSGTFVTADSTVALEQWTYAPLGGLDNYLVQCVKLFSWDGESHDSLIVGQFIDWDIPGDSGSINTSSIDFLNSLVYCQGLEASAAEECQPNNSRFGGMGLIGWTTFLNQGVFNDESSYANLYTASNDDFVTDPATNLSINDLYRAMESTSGLSAQSGQSDLHQVATVLSDYELAAFDTVFIYYVYATVRNGTSTDLSTAINAGRQWFTDNQANLIGPVEASFCCGQYDPENRTGNADYSSDGVKDLADVLTMAGVFFLGADPMVCPAEANVSGDPECVGDLTDILWLAGALFLGGDPPALCDPNCE